MRRWLVWLCFVTAGCRGLQSKLDAGETPGGGSSGGGVAAGGGGIAAGGGVGATGGGSESLRYASLTVPSSSADDGPVTAIGGRPAELYIPAPASRLLRSTGGAFTEITGTQLNAGVGVYVAPDGS